MLIMFKQAVKSLFYSFGLELRLSNPSSSEIAQILAAINHIEANLVLDVGANTGQFAQALRSIGFRGDLVSFEPLSSAHAQLSAAARYVQSWIIHPRVALGDHDGEVKINVSGNSVSSSILRMLESHSSVASESTYISSESTPLVRLDSIATQYLKSSSKLFLKIDTQGFEWQVLDGATNLLKEARGVLIELSLIPLYEDQKLWLAMIERMGMEGFTLWSIQRGFTDELTGRTLQVDAIFIRNDCV